MKQLKDVLLGAALLAGMAPVFAALPEYQPIPGVSPEPLPGPGFPSVEELAAFFDEQMAQQMKNAVGATVSFVKDGQVIFSKGYGYADLAKKIPVDPARTLFRPGSISKLFTATAAMQLVEQGKLDLNGDVNRYLTQFQLPATWSEPVRVKNLMTHTSGMESFVTGAQWKRSAADLLPLAEHLKRYMPPRVNPPATDFAAPRNAAYCNWCVALEGLLVANVSGMSFDEYQEKHIFAPLGMTRSSFREPLPEALQPDMAVGYKKVGEQFEAQDFEYIHGIGPAGNLTSTAADMAQFMIAHLEQGALGQARILREETAQTMHSRQVSPHPNVPGAGLAFSETYINGRRLIGHPGGTLYFSSRLLLYPEENWGLFLSFNTSGGGDSTALLKAFMDRYYPAKLPSIQPPADFAQRADRYVGKYRTYIQSQSTNEHTLNLISGGGAGYALSPEGTLTLGDEHWVEVKPDVFRNSKSEAMLAFGENRKGVLHALPHPYVALVKLRWYETAQLHYLLLGFSLLCFVVAIAAALWNWKRDRTAPDAARKARRLAALLGVTHLVFVGLVAKAFTSQFVFGLSPVIYVALALPLLAIPLTAAVLYFATRAWREKFWSAYGRVQYSVIALGSVVFMLSLNYWNLVGYKLS